MIGNAFDLLKFLTVGKHSELPFPLQSRIWVGDFKYDLVLSEFFQELLHLGVSSLDVNHSLILLLEHFRVYVFQLMLADILTPIKKRVVY